MGFRFRKSVKMGPFRLNFSKSGVGWSVGGKGYRYTKKANGGTRTTISAPGTGLSYVHETGGKRKAKTSAASSVQKTSHFESFAENLEKYSITMLKIFNVLYLILIVVLFVAGIPSLIFALPLGLILLFIAYIMFKQRKLIKKEIEYRNRSAALNGNAKNNVFNYPPTLPQSTTAQSPTPTLEDWITWQNLLMADPLDKLILTKEQLIQMTQVQIGNTNRIIQDCIKILSETKSPDTYFSRLDLFKIQIQHFEKLTSSAQKCVDFDSALTSELARLTSTLDKELQNEICKLIDRSFADTIEKAKVLKTEKGKINRYIKLYESFLLYQDRMSEDTVAHLEDKYNNTCSGSNNKIQSVHKNVWGESLDQLINGELPWGWITDNKEFVDKIDKEYSYFLQIWIDSRNGSPKQIYSALKPFVSYIKDTEELCKSKGECFEFWFYNILCSEEYIAARKQELYDLETNLDEEQEKYENKQKEIKERQQKAIEMKPEVIELLKNNDNILQSDFWKLFDKSSRDAVSDIVYGLLREGKIERTKSGRSYLLHFKE